MKEEIFDFDKHKGRKIKALVNYPLGGRVKKGEIGILKYGNIADFPSQSEYYCGVSDNFYRRFELLPEDDVKDVQFEVGKWYRIDKWVAKFKELKNKNEFWCDLAITTHDGYIDRIPGHFNLNSHKEPILLTDLSEIQQYLPEGHVDKIKKELTVDDLVEGDVYYHKCLRYSYIVKFRKLDSISITGEYYIDLETNNYYKNYRNTSITELRSATPAEKKWLLTCIKQDKFIEQSALDLYDDEGNIKAIEQKPSKDLVLGKFNIGDIVVSLTKCYNFRNIGSIFKVEEGSDKDYLYYLSGEKWSGAYNAWRLATPEEIEFYNQGGKNINDMKTKNEEFVLPKKWCIKRDENNRKVINPWFSRTENNKECFSFTSEREYLTSDHVNCSSWIPTTDTKPDGYTEITFEQFKKYVLKETKTKVEEKPKQEPMKAAVHVKTSEEFDFVISKIREVGYRYNAWNLNLDQSCISLESGGHCSKDYCLINNYKVISFEDWCKVNGYSKEEELKVEDYAVVLEGYKGMDLTPGNIVKLVLEEEDGFQCIDVRTPYSKNTHFIYTKNLRKAAIQEVLAATLPTVTVHIKNPFEITNTQENINILPKPKELEIVPISKYFKIRN